MKNVQKQLKYSLSLYLKVTFFHYGIKFLFKKVMITAILEKF
jgi:hypothetical protein